MPRFVPAEKSGLSRMLPEIQFGVFISMTDLTSPSTQNDISSTPFKGLQSLEWNEDLNW